MLKEHIRETLRADPLHDRRGLLRRLDAAAPDRVRLPRPARRDPADGELPRRLGDDAGGRGLPPAEPLLRERHGVAWSRNPSRTRSPARSSAAAAARSGTVRTGSARRTSATTRACGSTPRTPPVAGSTSRSCTTPSPTAAASAAPCPTTWSSIFGRRASDGFANRPYDNVGVQYGLHALQSGSITPEQFVDLNEHVGGLSIDWAFQPDRSVADPAGADAPPTAAALISHGRDLARVPIVDIRGQDNVEIHADFHSYAMRARLDRANGGHGNQVIWEGARPLVGDPAAYTGAFTLIDRWLGRIKADQQPAARSRRRCIADRPRDAVDTCWVEGRKITDTSTCRAAFPYFGDPRIAAGGTLRRRRGEVPAAPARSRRVPGRADRRAVRAAAERRSPAACATRAGRESASARRVRWPTFAGGPGGRALGPAPRSKPLR